MSELPEDPNERAAHLASRFLVEWPAGSGRVYAREYFEAMPEHVRMEKGVSDLTAMLQKPDGANQFLRNLRDTP